MKTLIRGLLGLKGYEIAKLNRFGRHPLTDIRSILSERHRPRVIFDVGANEGQTAIKFATMFGEALIYSFEPFHDAFMQLQKVALKHPRIHPVESALGDKIESQTLRLNAASATNSLLPNAPEASTFQPEGMADTKGVATVCVSTVDAYCRMHGVQSIDILKIDTQGYDLTVLRGAEQLIVENRVAIILAEVLFAPLYVGQAYFHEIYDHLWRRGFRLVNLYDVAINGRTYASWCDALFVHPDALAKRVVSDQVTGEPVLATYAS
jgi:FkbM family methyltransferase